MCLTCAFDKGTSTEPNKNNNASFLVFIVPHPSQKLE
jgi:hypothetical protein